MEEEVLRLMERMSVVCWMASSSSCDALAASKGDAITGDRGVMIQMGRSKPGNALGKRGKQ